MSCHPELNQYIQDTLHCVKPLLEKVRAPGRQPTSPLVCSSMLTDPTPGWGDVETIRGPHDPKIQKAVLWTATPQPTLGTGPRARGPHLQGVLCPRALVSGVGCLSGACGEGSGFFSHLFLSATTPKFSLGSAPQGFLLPETSRDPHRAHASSPLSLSYSHLGCLLEFLKPASWALRELGLEAEQGCECTLSHASLGRDGVAAGWGSWFWSRGFRSLQNDVEKVVVVILDKEHRPVEKFVFEITQPPLLSIR